MGPRRWVGWMAGLVPALLIGMHFLPIAEAAPVHGLAFPTSSTPAIVSAPRESLPLPVHDEATCAFCQAAAFAPHTARAVHALAVDTGDEQWFHLSQDTHLTPSGSARPPRSRAPPVSRSV